MHGFWQAVGLWTHGAGSFAILALTAWIWQRGAPMRSMRLPFVLALGTTGLWSFSAAAEPVTYGLTPIIETMRNLAWLFFMRKMVRTGNSGRQQSSVLAVYAVLTGVLAFQLGLDVLAVLIEAQPKAVRLLLFFSVVFRMIFAIGALVLVHNLYTGAAPSTRWGIRLPISALAIMWGYDLNLYTVTYLAHAFPIELQAMRGLVALAMAPVIAIGARRNEQLKLRLSRGVAFQSLSLVAIGGYLACMVVIAQAINYLGGSYAPLAQISFIFGMSVIALLALPTGKWQAWLKVTLTKNFFQHRYDYRAEWMRFTQTIGNPGVDEETLERRSVQALADIFDCPAGLLLTPDEDGDLKFDTQFNWYSADVPTDLFSARDAEWFRSTGYIVDLDQLRNCQPEDSSEKAARDMMPQWLIDETRCWTVVPLVHSHRLAGIIILARPPVVRRLDWEDLDMLRVASKQLASYLAEQSSQMALTEAQRFEDFHRRMAFVMHDIKNLSSQIGLLSRNAKRYADNPDFRADMIDTLEASSEKLNHLLARLSRFERGNDDRHGEFDLCDAAGQACEAMSGDRRLKLIAEPAPLVNGNADKFQQALEHLIMNALDASADNAPVLVRTLRGPASAGVEILDSGCGMSPEFVRRHLFKPFETTKSGGFGIGAYEARQLIKEMGGRLEVESQQEIGTRFTIWLPRSETVGGTGAAHESMTRERVA